MERRASTPLSAICGALPDLPARLREVGQFVVANEFDATTRSMRELASVAGQDPASFTRLAQALGYSGWDALRSALTEARRPAPATPFSGRVRANAGLRDTERLVARMCDADASGLARIDAATVGAAAEALHRSRRIWVAGFRSCRSPAELLAYQLRLFRTDEVRLVAGSGPEDLDFGAFRRRDAVVVFGFAPYSRVSVLTARAAHQAAATLVAVTDTASAPMAAGASHILLFEAASSPGFFPSLTGAAAIAQALAAASFALGGTRARRNLQEAEARLAATSQYVTEKSRGA